MVSDTTHSFVEKQMPLDPTGMTAYPSKASSFVDMLFECGPPCAKLIAFIRNAAGNHSNDLEDWPKGRELVTGDKKADDSPLQRIWMGVQWSLDLRRQGVLWSLLAWLLTLTNPSRSSLAPQPVQTFMIPYRASMEVILSKTA